MNQQLSQGFMLEWRTFQPQSLVESIQQAYHHYDAADIQHAFAQQQIQLNQHLVSEDQRLQPNDQVSLWLPQHQEAQANTDWKLLWLDNELLVVHKPAELPVSRTTRNLYNTLISLVRRHTEYKEAHLLHRLDAETSGLLVLAKHAQADKRWKKRLHKLLQRKVYHAVVWGRPTWAEHFAEHWLAELPNSPIRSQMHVVEPQQAALSKEPKLAQTTFKVLANLGDRSLIEAEIHTGRRHQIRAQLAHLGHPIVGDKIYSHQGRYYLKRFEQPLSAEDYATLGAPHHLLHAYQLELDIGLAQVTINNPYYPPAWPDLSGN